GCRRVLYRYPDLLSARPYKMVFVVEGEKDTDALWDKGLIATTCAQGAGKWKPEFSESLRDRNCVILPDNDGPGKKHAQQVAESLYPVAHSVQIIELPGLADKGDVSDWLSIPGNDAAALLALVEQAPRW